MRLTMHSFRRRMTLTALALTILPCLLTGRSASAQDSASVTLDADTALTYARGVLDGREVAEDYEGTDGDLMTGFAGGLFAGPLFWIVADPGSDLDGSRPPAELFRELKRFPRDYRIGFEEGYSERYADRRGDAFAIGTAAGAFTAIAFIFATVASH